MTLANSRPMRRARLLGGPGACCSPATRPMSTARREGNAPAAPASPRANTQDCCYPVFLVLLMNSFRHFIAVACLASLVACAMVMSPPHSGLPALRTRDMARSS